MKRLISLLLTAGLLPSGYAVAQRFPSDVAPMSVVGVELRGDTMIYRLVCGRDGELVDAEGRHYRLRPVKELSGPRHSLSLEIGAYPACGDRPIFPEMVDYEIAYPRFQGTFPGEWRYYEGSLRMTGAIGAAYTYRVRRWLEVAGGGGHALLCRFLARPSCHFGPQRGDAPAGALFHIDAAAAFLVVQQPDRSALLHVSARLAVGTRKVLLR